MTIPSSRPRSFGESSIFTKPASSSSRLVCLVTPKIDRSPDRDTLLRILLRRQAFGKGDFSKLDLFGPAEVPAKRLYAFRHAQRVARDLGLPLRCPPSHPFKPLLALRVMTCFVDEPVLRSQVISTLSDAVWAQGRPIDTAPVLRAALDSVGFDLEAFIEAAGGPEAKARLRQQTDEAIARGVFGVPTAVVEDELYWGADSLPHLERHLRGDALADDGELERWRHIDASAKRRPKSGR